MLRTYRRPFCGDDIVMASKSKDIIDAVKTTILGLSLSGIEDANVVIRKVKDEAGMTLPGIIIAFVKRTPAKTSVTHYNDWIYQVDVVVLAADNHSITHNDAYAGWLESIDNAFQNKRLDDVRSVYDCEVAPGDAVSREGWDAQKLVGIRTLKFISREAA